jgi:hypothetical protein
LEGEVQAARDILLNAGRDADAAWLGHAFEASRDIDAVAEDVAVLDDDVADIDADAPFDAPICRYSGIPLLTPACTSIAQRKASTTLENSTRSPSPVVFTIRPRLSAILRSIRSPVPP